MARGRPPADPGQGIPAAGLISRTGSSEIPARTGPSQKPAGCPRAGRTIETPGLRSPKIPMRQIANKGWWTDARGDRAYERCKRTSFVSAWLEGLLYLLQTRERHTEVLPFPCRPEGRQPASRHGVCRVSSLQRRGGISNEQSEVER